MLASPLASPCTYGRNSTIDPLDVACHTNIMIRAADNYIPREVHVWRPHFDPSPELANAVSKLIENERAIDHLKIYGSKEVSIDLEESLSHRYSIPIARTDTIFRAHTAPIHLSGDVRVKLMKRYDDYETVRVAMKPHQQAYFNKLVNLIDRTGIDDLLPQPGSAQHYLYFDVRPDDLASTQEERILRLKEFGRAVTSRLHFVRPDEYLGHREIKLINLEPEPPTELSDDNFPPLPYYKERSA